LERLKFIAIFASNLDEFFMKRMAVHHAAADGATPAILERAHHLIAAMVEEQRECLAALMRALDAHGVRVLGWADLGEAQRREAARFFPDHVSPALTPPVADGAHPFPFLSNLSLSWACRLRDGESDTPVYGRVKVATGLPPWIPVRAEAPAGSHWFISLPE